MMFFVNVAVSGGARSATKMCMLRGLLGSLEGGPLIDSSPRKGAPAQDVLLLQFLLVAWFPEVEEKTCGDGTCELGPKQNWLDLGIVIGALRIIVM